MAFGNALAYPALNYNDAAFRDFVDATVGGRSGVVGASALAVTQQSSAGPTVQVASGDAFIKATAAGLNGSFFTRNDATANSPTITATSTNGRKDRLIVRITNGLPALEVVQGTAGPSPAEPAITGSNYLELALITLPGGTTNVTDAMIQDRRVWMGGDYPRIVTSATRPGLYPGRHIYEADTGRVVVSPDGTTWVRGPWFLSGGRSEIALSRTTAQAIADDVVTAVTLSPVTNADSWSSPDGGQSWTVPAGLGGLYAVRIRVDWGAAGGTVIIPNRGFIQLRWGAAAANQSRSIVTSDGSSAYTDIIPLNAGDTLKLEVYQHSASSQNVGQAFLNAYRVGA